MRKYQGKKRYAKKIAKERIDILFTLADKATKNNDFELARRYVELILKISRKYKVRLKKEQKYMICKKCHTYLLPGKTAKVRLKRGKVVVKCERCGNYKRYPIKRTDLK